MARVTAVNHWHSTALECTDFLTLDVLFSVYHFLTCILVEHQPSPYIHTYQSGNKKKINNFGFSATWARPVVPNGGGTAPQGAFWDSRGALGRL